MWNVLITYDYDSPPTPREVMVVTPGLFPKCNYRLVGQAATMEEGERLGQEAFDKEMHELVYLTHDPVTLEMKATHEAALNALDDEFEVIKKKYADARQAMTDEYQAKHHARRVELVKAKQDGTL